MRAIDPDLVERESLLLGSALRRGSAKPPPAFSGKVNPATPTSTAVIVLGENLSI